MVTTVPIPSSPLSELLSDCSRAAELLEQSRMVWNPSAGPSCLCNSRRQAGLSCSGKRQKNYGISLKVVQLTGTEVVGLYCGRVSAEDRSGQPSGEEMAAVHPTGLRDSSVPGWSPGKLSLELETEDKTLP